MAQTAKKTSAPTKPRKTATRKKTPTAGVTRMMVSHEEISRLAHRYWAERGHQHGQDVEDWFRAEQKILGIAS
jgi:hypothetical protein